MKVNTRKMRPYVRIKTVKGSLWEKDIHPPKGHKNWWEDDPISLKSVIEGLLHVDIEFYKQKIINFVKWI